MRGKGRVTIQFECCFNYAKASHHEKACRMECPPNNLHPDSCIVNIYDEGDCVPPHIDSHDFLLPFCTVSFLSKHCVPAVPTKRMSITIRRMDESKRPVGFVPEQDLHGIQPLSYEVDRLEESSPQIPQPVPAV
uniref:Fe2OG dioxygenase domain-containing protein n=1 Tax=Kalanchoe fedtschenkoi TaxID=63787 RepID=A0A7N0T176_KALFE